MLIPYDRDRAVQYAHTWAFQRNPQYYSYDLLGGDCTNFASQCLYAGSGIMNHTPTFGWYYYSGDNKAPAWTGVSYLFQFLTRKQQTPGPAAQVVGPDELRPGDLVRLRFAQGAQVHMPVVVAVGQGGGLGQILVAAHSDDADFRPLSSYPFHQLWGLHILGSYR